MQLGNSAVHGVEIGLHGIDVGRRPLQKQDHILELRHHPHHALQLLDGLGIAILYHVKVKAVLFQDGLVGFKAHLLFQLCRALIQPGNAVPDLGRGIQQGVQLVVKLLVVLVEFVSVLKLVYFIHERFGDILSAVNSKTSSGCILFHLICSL